MSVLDHIKGCLAQCSVSHELRLVWYIKCVQEHSQALRAADMGQLISGTVTSVFQTGKWLPVMDKSVPGTILAG